MGKTFNAAQRAARKGRKRQQRKIVGRQHVQDYRDARNAPREVAMAAISRIEKRERINKLKHHTPKADRKYEWKTQ